MDLGLRTKRALVLGGGRGIGRGIAATLAAEGARVALVARDRATLEAAADEMNRTGGEAMAVPADLKDWSSVQGAHERVVRELGGVDILVNNCGGPPPTSALGVADSVWHEQFQAMVLSIFKLTELALPGMRERRWGRIITVASIGVVQPIRMLAISNSLRSAVAGWSKTLATEVARDRVTVNVLLPGSIKTQRILGFWEAESKRSGKSLEQIETEFAATLPTGRLGTIEEFGAIAAFVASEQAAYITGSMIRVDGGSVTSIGG
jgi:3-oxoacyl-[acyl-carrier protein] reductase